MLSVKLVVVGGDAKSKEVQLKLPTVIGRGREGVTLTLPHKLVSRKHTELFENEGQLFVRDLGSLNGTFVNNQRIDEPKPLKPNELLTLGNVTFRAIYDAVGATSGATITTPNVLDESSSDSSQDSDTGKSLIGAAAEEAGVAEAQSSDIFANNELTELSPEKSISMSAIDGLPTGQNAVFDVQLDGNQLPEAVNNVEIELDEPLKTANRDDSKLGSFLKKLPR